MEGSHKDIAVFVLCKTKSQRRLILTDVTYVTFFVFMQASTLTIQHERTIHHTASHENMKTFREESLCWRKTFFEAAAVGLITPRCNQVSFFVKKIVKN